MKYHCIIEIWLLWRYILNLGGLVNPVNFYAPAQSLPNTTPYISYNNALDCYIGNPLLSLDSIMEIQLKVLQFLKKQLFSSQLRTKIGNYIIRCIVDVLEMIPNLNLFNATTSLETVLYLVSFVSKVIKEYSALHEVISHEFLREKIIIFIVRAFRSTDSWVNIEADSKLVPLTKGFVECFQLIISSTAPSKYRTSYRPAFARVPLSQDLSHQVIRLRFPLFFQVLHKLTIQKPGKHIPFEINREIALFLLQNKYESILSWNHSRLNKDTTILPL